MKTIATLLLAIVVLFLPVPTIAPAQTQAVPSIAFTNSLANGRFWANRSFDEKRTWLFGYSDGIKTAAAAVYAAEPDDKALQKFMLDLQPTNTLTPLEWVEAVDRFYQDAPENAPVPIAGAMRYVERKASGATPAELEVFAASLRKAAATQPSK